MATYQAPPQNPGAAPQKPFLNKSTIIWGIVGFLAIILLVGGCSSYNGMVTAEQMVKRTDGDLQAAYQRRFDLIPNLVSAVKGYSRHESTTLQNVTDARVGLVHTGDSLEAASRNVASMDMAQKEALAKSMNIYVNAVKEAYPDLKANETYRDLMTQLESTENRVNQERNNYNQAVEAYNNKVLRFPGNIFAGMFGFQEKEPYRADAQAAAAPKVGDI